MVTVNMLLLPLILQILLSIGPTGPAMAYCSTCRLSVVVVVVVVGTFCLVWPVCVVWCGVAWRGDGDMVARACCCTAVFVAVRLVFVAV